MKQTKKEAILEDYHRIMHALAEWLDDSGTMPSASTLMPDSETETFQQAIQAAFHKAGGRL